jgi:uncharacterized glyoxalase superfamily protein PhnB
MPRIEHFRKQAKLHLRWHREGYYPVAAIIREMLPRFAALSDQDILRAGFKLADAQELVARRAGFESWQALLKEREPTTDTPSSSTTATILAAEPQLFVTDMAAAIAYYTDRLGFSLAFSYGEPAFYAQVARGGARLNLRVSDGPIGFRAEEMDALSATLTVDAAKSLFLEFQQADASFHQPLRTEPWGARTFIVADPDGNLLCFAGPA